MSNKHQPFIDSLFAIIYDDIKDIKKMKDGGTVIDRNTAAKMIDYVKLMKSEKEGAEEMSDEEYEKLLAEEIEQQKLKAERSEKKKD